MDRHAKNILLVDDDKDDMQLFMMALRNIDSSHKLLYGDDGVSALRLLHNQELPLPDYIFLDLNMHRMNGKECLVEIKNSEYLSQIPVVICTTSKIDIDVQITRDLGATGFFTKPINFKDLVSGIRFILGKKQAAGQYLNSLIEVF